MQVDVYLRKRDAEAVCQAMEMNAVKVLAELFHASTSGMDPISLDWDLDDNKALLGHDINIIAAMKKLQELSQDYCKFWLG
jgi:kynurenine formamidase